MSSSTPDVKSVFGRAAEIASPADRMAFLDGACAGHPDVRAEVEVLLKALGDAGSFMGSPAAPADETGSDDSITEGEGTVIGPYTLRELIGEGGMGLVFVAEQQHPVRRKVALKVIKPGMDSRQVVARFEAERQALALMDHPNIAKVFDAGTTGTGRPYFVMELVRGVPITEYADANHLTPRDRLGLFIQVCHAVQHAHQKGIIHRDLKPSNILVAPHDGIPVVKVIDFGVAKALGQSLTEKTIYTRFAQMIGTPLYMSPEQAEVNQLDVDTRSDIYSLGVLLYELLTGTTPFDGDRFRKAAFDEIRRIIKEEEPPRPSTRLTSLGATLTAVSAKRSTDPGRLSALVRGELDWIVMKCLEKDRTRRYDGATALAKDVQRYLTGDAVEACPPTLGYRLKKAYRKNRAALLGGGAFAAVLLAATGVSIAFALHADRSKRVAEIARGDAAGALGIAVTAEQEAEQKRIETAAALGQLRLAQTEQQANQYVWDMQMFPSIRETGNVAHARLLLDRHPVQLRGFEWYYWNRQAHGELGTHVLPDVKSGSSQHWEFSADGTRVAQAVTGSPVALTVWDVATRKKLLNHEMMIEKDPIEALGGISGAGPGQGMRLSPNGTRFALVCPASPPVPAGPGLGPRPFDSRLQVVDVDSRKLLLDHDDRKNERFKLGQIINTWFSPDGRKLAIEARPKPNEPNREIVHLWDLDAGKGPFTIECGCGIDSPFSPDGSRILLRKRDADGIALVACDTATGEILQSCGRSKGPIRAYSPDGIVFASVFPTVSPGGPNESAQTLRLWDVVAGKERYSLPLPVGRGGFSSLAGPFFRSAGLSFSRDGSRVAVKGATDTGGEQVLVFGTADGKKLCTVTTPRSEALRFVGNPLPDVGPLLSPDGKQLVVATGNVVTVWDATTGLPLRTLRGHVRTVAAYSFTGVGRLRSIEEDGTLKEWDLKLAEPLVLPTGTIGRIGSMVASANGQWVATGPTSVAPLTPPGAPGPSWGVQVWNVAEKRATTLSLGSQKEDLNWHSSLALSNNGRVAVTRIQRVPGGGRADDKVQPESGDLTVWDASSGKEMFRTKLLESNFRSNDVIFSPDGEMVAVALALKGGSETQVKLFGVGVGREVRTVRVPGSVLGDVRFSPDGHRLAAVEFAPGSTGGPPGKGPPTLAVWDVTTGDRLLTVTLKHEVSVLRPDLCWSPDGTRLAIDCPLGGTLIAIHDALTGEQVTAIESPDRGTATSDRVLRNLVFSPDGRRIVLEVQSGSGPGSSESHVEVWDVGSGKPLLTLRSPNTPGPQSLPGYSRLAFTPDGHRLLYFKQDVLGPRGGAPSDRVTVTTWDATPIPEPAKP